MGPLGREDQGEGGAGALAAVELDAAALGVGDRAHDREAESGAVGAPASVGDAVEAVEDVLVLGGWDAGAAVGDPQPGGVAGERGVELDAVARLGVLDGVLGRVA